MAELEKLQMYIGGQRCDAASGETFESLYPFTGKAWATVPRGGAEDVDRAVAAAKKALTSGDWPAMTPTQRGHMLRKLGDVLTANAERLGKLEVQDNGKLIAEMGLQTQYSAQWYYYFGGLADKIEGSVLPIDKPDTFTYTRSEPLGVVGMITPWNSPILLLTWKLAVALAAAVAMVGAEASDRWWRRRRR